MRAARAVFETDIAKLRVLYVVYEVDRVLRTVHRRSVFELQRRVAELYRKRITCAVRIDVVIARYIYPQHIRTDRRWRQLVAVDVADVAQSL